MADKVTSVHPHRLNDNGSFDSICPICFVTIATADTEAELIKEEQKHVCPDEQVAIRRTDQLRKGQ